MNEEAIARIRAHEDAAMRRCASLRRTVLEYEQHDIEDWMLPEHELYAHAIVATMGELEGFIRNTVRLVHETLNERQVPGRLLNPRLRALCIENHVASLRDTTDIGKAWGVRRKITLIDSTDEPASFPLPKHSPTPPLDGRTIREYHCARIWDVYGLASNPFPKIAIMGYLKKLAGIRNDVAHCNIPVEDIFKQEDLRGSRLAGYLIGVASLMPHQADAWTDWLANESYLHNR